MSKRTKCIFTVLFISTMTFILAGCNLKIGYVNKTSTKKTSASFFYLSSTKNISIKLKSGDSITFDYELIEKKGSLVATFEDSSGNLIYSFDTNSDGIEEIKIDMDDTYELIIDADKAKGSYKFEWEIN